MAIALNRNGKFAFAAAPASLNLAGFKAISSATWTDVGRVRDFGEIGDSFETIDDMSIDDPRIKKYSTVADGGTTAVQLNYDSATTGNGQKSLRAKNGLEEIGFRYIEPAAADGGGGRTLFWAGTISEWKEGSRAANSQQTSTFNMNVNTELFVDTA